MQVHFEHNTKTTANGAENKNNGNNSSTPKGSETKLKQKKTTKAEPVI